MQCGQLGETRATKHRIDRNKDAKPVYQQPYRTGLKRGKIVAEEMAEIRKSNFIEPAPPYESQFASPFVLVAKKDGSVRF